MINKNVKNIAKKLGINLMVKRNGKYVYKSENVLKKQIANRTTKRKSRFGGRMLTLTARQLDGQTINLIIDEDATLRDLKEVLHEKTSSRTYNVLSPDFKYRMFANQKIIEGGVSLKDQGIKNNDSLYIVFELSPSDVFGVNPDTIRKMTEPDICAICQEDMTEFNPELGRLAETKCGHIFHESCLELLNPYKTRRDVEQERQMARRQGRRMKFYNKTCPLCRTPDSF
jgi:hypothetical protein